MVKVFFSKDTHPGGKKGITVTTSKRVSVPEGTTLMEAARKIKLPEIPAMCGGNCACGTCHVYIDEFYLDKVPPIRACSPEIDLLQEKESFDNKRSRLSCQIKLTKELDGLLVHLLDDELL